MIYIEKRSFYRTCDKHKPSFFSFRVLLAFNSYKPFESLQHEERWKADPAQRDFNGKRIEEVPCTRTNKKYLRSCAGNTSGAREAAGDTKGEFAEPAK